MTQAGDVLMLFDFTQPEARPWTSIDDVVMGGVSRSAMRVENERAVFEGTVSLESGGGFASVRSAPGSWDLSACEGIQVTFRGDGRRYKLRIRPDSRFDNVNWEAGFQTRAGERDTMRFPFQGLVPVYRGSRVPDAPPLDLHRIAGFGFLISDRQAGPFRLEIEYITAYRR